MLMNRMKQIHSNLVEVLAQIMTIKNGLLVTTGDQLSGTYISSSVGQRGTIACVHLLCKIYHDEIEVAI